MPNPAALAKKAHDILKANCYRCHGQDGAVEGGFNYVLDFKTLVDAQEGRPRRRCQVDGCSSASPATTTRCRPKTRRSAPARTTSPLSSSGSRPAHPTSKPARRRRAFLTEADVAPRHPPTTWTSVDERSAASPATSP